jgi:4-carboxymuconolactone decarboxylase
VGPLASHVRSRHCSLSEREIELAVCVINVKRQTPHSIDAHAKRAKELGLPTDMVDALVCGPPGSFLDKREQAINEMATMLANSRCVPQGLYDRAVRALGHDGITDVIVLMGYYTALSLTLAFTMCRLVHLG